MTSAATISFACDGCGRPFSVPSSFAGRKATCKACGKKVVVPAAAAIPDEQNTLSPGDPSAAPRVVRTAVISEAQSSPTSAGIEPPAILQDEPLPPANHPASAPKSPPAKLPVRVRRLINESNEMARVFSGEGPIRVKSAVGDPPELYQIEYHVTGLYRGWMGKPKKRDMHLVEIQLTSEYPRVSPICRMLTPVFHPNIDETTICVGDHWTAGERLVDLVVRIGEMIAYQAYNIKSPLNGEAAMWADLNSQKLPIDTTSLRPDPVAM